MKCAEILWNFGNRVQQSRCRRSRIIVTIFCSAQTRIMSQRVQLVHDLWKNVFTLCVEFKLHNVQAILVLT